jgi:hypothetical protein
MTASQFGGINEMLSEFAKLKLAIIHDFPRTIIFNASFIESQTPIAT